MGSTTHAIEVNAPLRAVYNQWTQFEEFPSFMEGVDEVRQDGPNRLLWKVNIGGRDKEWEAEITEQIPDAKIAWQSIDGTPNSGEVNFESLDSESTRITLTIQYEPEGLLEKAGDVLGIPSGRVEADLKRFREFIEDKGSKSDGWRGTIGTTTSLASSVTNKNQADFANENSSSSDKEGEVLHESTLESHNKIAPIEKDWPAHTATEQSEPLSIRESPIKLPDQTSANESAFATWAEPEPPSVDAPRVTQEEIASRAYELYLERGQLPGYEEQDWLEAEKQLTTRFGR
jgi:hypothetical protein